MIMFGSFLPSLLVGFSTTNSTRAWEPTLSWNQLHSKSPDSDTGLCSIGTLPTLSARSSSNYSRLRSPEKGERIVAPHEQRQATNNRIQRRLCPDSYRSLHESV